MRVYEGKWNNVYKFRAHLGQWTGLPYRYTGMYFHTNSRLQNKINTNTCLQCATRSELMNHPFWNCGSWNGRCIFLENLLFSYPKTELKIGFWMIQIQTFYNTYNTYRQWWLYMDYFHIYVEIPPLKITFRNSLEFSIISKIVTCFERFYYFKHSNVFWK